MFDFSHVFNIFEALLGHHHLIQTLTERRSLSVKGLAGSSRLLFIEQIMVALGPGLVVLPDASDAETFAEEALSYLGEDRVAYFPSDEDLSRPATLNPRQTGMRMEVLRDLLNGTLELVVASGQSLFQGLPDPQQIQNTRILLKPGSQIDLQDLIAKLIQFGYTREPMVERPGEISLRGGIVDIFPYTGEMPHRIEFYGNEIESIRTFETDTQRSTGQAAILDLIASPENWVSSEKILPDYFPIKPWAFIQDWDLMLSRILEAPERYNPQSTTVAQSKLESLITIYYDTLTTPRGTFHFNIQPLPALDRSPEKLRNQIKRWLKKHTVIFLCDPPRQKDRMADFLNLYEDPLPAFQLLESPLRSGFQMPDASLVVISQTDLFRRTHHRPPKKRFIASSTPIREMTALKKGDYVVHIDHGIGAYQGLEKITVAGSERECLAIRYKDRDMLYVPADKMERVQKYAGREGYIPELSKLGTMQWERIKSNTKKSVEKIAKELIQLYSARQAKPGYAFSPDTTWQNDLEASFVYDETPDQAAAIQDVKSDMENPVPMDRLICGDVGYGKTEIAVRAAFKAVNDGKQVAVLVPTTVLAQQHYCTFTDRLSSFPVMIQMLSRFRSKKNQKQIVEDLNSGKVDIVIGTHRLLSQDVRFKNLGLLIIDEEHKFGVRHKERIKSLRETVDVLALSATPIPRTLNLSLVGIRDMSLINTPPRDRLPIHTEVLPFNESVITEAILQELQRQGQIFFVHNRIQTIQGVARMIERLVPGIRLAVVHGQMNEHELEKRMLEFVEQKFDCLVATLIVGSGLDMPHVNTLLVNRADRLGLSQLYQLRGRVGRSNQKAYAYLFTPRFSQLKPEAIKRLRTIEEFTELGAGFQIAMRDLEIRGAGNLLGYQQSGNINAVGFELYTQLVAEAVDQLKSGQEEPAPVEAEAYCTAQIDRDAYIPEHYIGDESTRVNIYKRLSSVTSESELEDLSVELKDRFGPIPESAEALISLIHIQILGTQRHVHQIRIENRKLRLFFDRRLPESFDSPDSLSRHLHHLAELSDSPIRYLTEHGLGLELLLPEQNQIQFTKKWLQSWG
jgi:transcription-repair coupling factor (superfamily II helicase)